MGWKHLDCSFVSAVANQLLVSDLKAQIGPIEGVPQCDATAELETKLDTLLDCQGCSCCDSNHGHPRKLYPEGAKL